MSKAVMCSIQPKWCELIANGKKTIEVRKTIPKLETPFKVYMYCTKAKDKASVDGYTFFADELYIDHWSKKLTCGHTQFEEIVNGKVIGEFMCDKIYDITPHFDVPTFPNQYIFEGVQEKDSSCLSFEEINSYLKGNQGYGLHISDLVIYDEPKELTSFYRPCPYEDNDDISCYLCDKSGRRPDDASLDCFYFCEKPPQSWCYVEELSGA